MAVAEQTLANASDLDTGSAAFPPFESSTYLSQIFWLVIIFGLLYWLMSTIALPRVGAILENRRNRIEGDLADAYVSAAKFIGAGLAAIGMGAAAIGVGTIFGNFLSGALRNPSAADGQFGRAFIGAALAEGLGIFAFLVAILLLFVK